MHEPTLGARMCRGAEASAERERFVPQTQAIRKIYPVPKKSEQSARNWLRIGAHTPARARPASAVALVRDTPEGLNLWLGSRGDDSPLGKVSCAGGSCLPSDEDPVTWYGPSPTEWAHRLGLADHRQAQRHVVAAARELFEETGVLLAGPGELGLAEDVSGEEWMRARRALADEEITFAELLGKRGWGVRTDLLRPLSHWISPDFELRRFDTIYFAAAVPAGQDVCTLQGSEKWGRWVGVHEAAIAPESTALGDEIGEEGTRGVPLSELVTPVTAMILTKLRRVRGCVPYLSAPRALKVYKPVLLESDDKLMLEVETLKADDRVGVARGR